MNTNGRFRMHTLSNVIHGLHLALDLLVLVIVVTIGILLATGAVQEAERNLIIEANRQAIIQTAPERKITIKEAMLDGLREYEREKKQQGTKPSPP